MKAIASGLLTLGAVHGPIEAAYDLLADSSPMHRADVILRSGGKVPGWGNAFVKGGPDLGWAEVENRLPDWKVKSLEDVTAVLHAHGKRVWLNPAGYTAAVAHLVRMPGRVAPWLFVQGRLAGWSELIGRKGGGQ
jgi:citrate synthase